MRIIDKGEVVVITSHDSESFNISNIFADSEQRELLVWFYRNKPELIREIFCSECPEHIGELERKAYVMNECERGHKP